jgi:hypothetical protein
MYHYAPDSTNYEWYLQADQVKKKKKKKKKKKFIFHLFYIYKKNLLIYSKREKNTNILQ